jgi:indole-3-glycerol phosphate synthase
MIDAYQVVEARAMGADAILLIAAALELDQMRELEQCAHELGMDVLVEVHNAEELMAALQLKTPLLSINNRNLKTFEVDLATTEQLAEEVPDDVLLVSESGIKSPADAMRVLEAGANAVLIGEALMRAHDPSREIEAYLALELA